jgi:asparagine synthase (glutamine-hydrolysing)
VCGIFGFTGAPDAERLGLLAGALLHRGPDGTGTWVSDDMSLGCDRLAIVGRADGAQPLASEDGRLHLVCNGEIYNFRALRRELAARGHRFATGSDAEVVLHGFEDQGDAFLARLHGMYGLALWDEGRRRLLLARDPAGMKPLFYTLHQGRLWFASEAKALLLATDLARRPDLRALDGLLRLGFVPGARTLFAGIERLPAGHCLTLDAAAGSGPRVAPLPAPSTLPWPPASRTPAALAGELRRRLAAAVESHLDAEVPVGASLSGGLDSSFLVGLMAERLGQGVKTYTIGSPGDQDERPFARRVADRFRTDHHEITATPDDLLAGLPLAVWRVEEPRNAPLVLNDLLFARAARDVGVLLIGEGSDELFGGYLRFKTALPPLGWLPPRWAAALYGTRKIGAAAARLYDERLRAARAQEDPLATHLGPALALRGSRRLAALLAYERDVQLPNAHLPRVDLLSMAHALEARLPFLDPGVVELAGQVPARLQVSWRSEKMLVRAASRDLLPADIWRRRKQGQANPLRLWQAAGLLDLAAELLAPAVLRARGLFQPRYVAHLLARLRRGRGLPFDRNRLNLLMLIEVWQRVFIDPPRLAPPLAGAPYGAGRQAAVADGASHR